MLEYLLIIPGLLIVAGLITAIYSDVKATRKSRLFDKAHESVENELALLKEIRPEQYPYALKLLQEDMVIHPMVYHVVNDEWEPETEEMKQYGTEGLEPGDYVYEHYVHPGDKHTRAIVQVTDDYDAEIILSDSFYVIMEEILKKQNIEF